MKYDFDQVIDRRGTNCSKWEGMRSFDPRAGEGTLPFWVADMDFACPPCVIEALHARVERQIFGYSEPGERFYRAAADWCRARHGLLLEREALVTSPGVVPALGYLIRLMTQPGDGVIIQTPVYYPFARKIKEAGRVVVENPLTLQPDGRYVMDFEDLRRKVKDNKLLILCSPHNPVGRVWTREELETLVDICAENGVKIISDEIHSDLLRVGAIHTPTQSVRAEYQENIVTCFAPSKTFNLAGMQCAFVVINDGTLRARWKEHVAAAGCSGPGPLSIVTTQAAYEGGAQWLDELRVYLDGNIAFMAEYLARHMPKARFDPPEGTYLTWIDFRAYGLAMDALMEAFVSHGALPEAGAIFGAGGEGFVRMNIACPRSILREGLSRMASALDEVARA